MKAEEIKQYRTDINVQLKEKESDIETTITYVTIGLLGFFLTINEKFIPLKTSNYKVLMLLSVFSFFFSFFLGLINKLKTTKYDREIINIIDNADLTQEKDEQLLLEKWKNSDSNLQSTKKFIYIFLVLGIIFQLVYFFLNVNSISKEVDTLKIEINNSEIDSILKNKNINILIYQNKDSLVKNDKKK